MPLNCTAPADKRHMAYDVLIRRIYAMAHDPIAKAAKLIARETNVEMLTQALDVAHAQNMVALMERIDALAGEGYAVAYRKSRCLPPTHQQGE
jgi:hypothetical protein